MTSAKSRAGSTTENVGVKPRSRAERYAAGKALREKCPRVSHGAWTDEAQPAPEAADAAD